MSFRPAAAPTAAPAPPPRQRRSGLFSDAIALRPGVVVPRSAPTGGDARPAMMPIEDFRRRVENDGSLTADQKVAALATEDRRREMITRMHARGEFLTQYDDRVSVPLEVRPVADLEKMYGSFKVWEADQDKTLAASRGPALAGDEMLHRAYARTGDQYPPPDRYRFRIGDEFHPRHGPNPESRAAFAPSLAEESATGGLMTKLKGVRDMAVRSAKAAVDLDSWTLDCEGCKNRGDPPSLDAAAFNGSVIAGVPVPVVVVATHKQWKPTKSTPGFSVPKAYTNDDGDYVTDFVDAKEGNPSGRFPFPPTVAGADGRKLQSFRDVVFAAGLRKAAYMTPAEGDERDDPARPARRSAMGRGHPAVHFESVDELAKSELAYPYSCVRDALLQGGKGDLLQYVKSKGDFATKPAHEQQPSVLPHPDNGNIKDACVYTAMAAVWIPYDLPRLWSRYVCILVPVGASVDGEVAMGHAIFVPHKDYGVVAPPADPTTGKLLPWRTAQTNYHFDKLNYRGDRGTRGGDAKLPGYDLLGAYAVDTNMVEEDEGKHKGEDLSPQSRYGPAVALASRMLIVPYLKTSVEAFVSDEKRKQSALESIEQGNQLGALIELNKTFREGAVFNDQKSKNPQLAYRTYVETVVQQVAGFEVREGHIYDHAMLDTAARAARALVQSKGTRAGLGLGLGALLADYGARKKGSENVLKASRGKLAMTKGDYDRQTGAEFAADEPALEDLWDSHDGEGEREAP